MGTMADFYTKVGNDLIWEGSVHWDGHPDRIAKNIVQATSNEEFRNNVKKFISSRDDGILGNQPWPWSWDSSKLTDYSYIMVEEKGLVFCSEFGGRTFTIYDYRNYFKRYKQAAKERKEIEDFEEFVEKLGNFAPKFPSNRKKYVVNADKKDRGSDLKKKDR